ncbi:hypothetical protein VTL71DRAFT_7254 [Oculimacula yallundae]|uniref:NmrA-like domain-containing protein n=1 Tax=Oculimacula yallundae TaxID=86028 RepID=A0ABR4BXN0_9HELO
MADYNKLVIKKIVVFGGTGAQGSPIVRALSASPQNFQITIPTRNLNSAPAIELSKLPNVSLLLANYQTETGLRAIFAGQDACYFNLNSFTLLESQEYFLTFRAYEIAVQSGLKWFVLSGSPDRYAMHGYQEKYRNSHGVVSGRLSSWLENQPLSVLPWTVLHGGVYAQMLSSLLAPALIEPDGNEGEGVYEFAAPIGSAGTIPFVDVDDYGVRTRYVLEHPEECVGKTIGWAPWYTTYPELVKAFESVTGKRALLRDCSQNEWFERLKAYVDPETSLPIGSDRMDGERKEEGKMMGTFTFRESFGAWWNLWRDYDKIRDLDSEAEVERWSDMVAPGRARSLEEWMRRSGYTGKFAEVQKAKIEENRAKLT